MIIALAGRKGSGKTTAAEIFIKRGFKQVSFAAPLKSIVSKIFGLSLETLNDPVAKENYQISVPVTDELISKLIDAAEQYLPIDANAKAKAYSVERPLLTTPRQALQFVGTDLFRDKVNENFWLMLFEAQLDPNQDYICDDCRFLNEANMINKLKGKVILIKRPGLASTDNHPSEQVHLLPYDYKITNFDINHFRNDMGIMLDLIKRQDNEPKVQR